MSDQHLLVAQPDDLNLVKSSSTSKKQLVDRMNKSKFSAKLDQDTKEFLEREKELYEDQNFLDEEELDLEALKLKKMVSIRPADLQEW